MPKDFNLGDYVQVDQRIAEFRAKHPNGALQSEVILWPTQELAFVGVKAWAYRTADDERPGIGLAWEPFPGKTPYTKDSELQNAETSAWGRAIVAVLASDTRKGIATAEDVRNRQPESNYQGTPTKASEGPPSEVSLSGPAQTTPLSTRQAPSDSSDAEAHKGRGVDPSHSTASDGNGQEPGTSISPAGVAESPAPADPARLLTSDRVKVVAAALGGQKFALDLARDEFGDSVRTLRDITEEQAAELLDIKGVTA